MSAIWALLLVLFLPHLSAQQPANIEGFVRGEGGNGLEGAKVYWEESETGTLSGPDGTFTLPASGLEHAHIVVIYPGYVTDTFCNEGESPILIELSALVLDDVEIRDQRQGILVGNDGYKTEVINRTELEKGACCDLAGCFNTESSVEARTTNIITNSKELQILGLSGVYNQLLLDGVPLFRGLSYTYGISGIPGPLVETIYISKGAGSVQQGFEGISGQLNVLLPPAQEADRLYLNAYANSFGEQQYNAAASQQAGKWSFLEAAHLTLPAAVIDRDEDGFRDLAAVHRVHGLVRAQYRDEDSLGWSSTVTGRFLLEDRLGGQTDYDRDLHQGTMTSYGQTAHYVQPELSLRARHLLPSGNALLIQAAGQWHDQQSWFGITSYQATQALGYASTDYLVNWKETQSLRLGLSMRYLDLKEDIRFQGDTLGRDFDGTYRMQERIPGVMAENTARFAEGKITLITGVRADLHSTHGPFITPRGLLRYTSEKGFSARFSAGTGYRTPAIFSENIRLLASSRNIEFQEAILPERSLNLGLNLDQKWDLNDAVGRVSADLYRTSFSNQFFPDYDEDPRKAIIRNFSGTSLAHGLQLETTWEFLSHLEVRLAYNYLEVYRQNGGERLDLPFIPRHKMVMAVSYWTNERKFHADANMHVYGRQRLPETTGNPQEFQVPTSSQPYTLLNLQLSYQLGRWNLYMGSENILGFRQYRPILSWEAPFSPWFDTSFAWGPTRGREFYAGLRYRIKK